MKTKPKAQLITDPSLKDRLSQRVLCFREAASKRTTADGYVRGTGSYALYGIIHAPHQCFDVDVIASEPTSADFNPYVTAKAKATVLSKGVYDQLVEYRDVGSSSSPKVTILCWELA